MAKISSNTKKTMTNTTIHKIIKFYNFFNKCKIALKLRKNSDEFFGGKNYSIEIHGRANKL